MTDSEDSEDRPPAATPSAPETVTAVTPPFSGLGEASAEARCPAGYVCDGGGIDIPEGAVVTASRLADDANGWFGAFAGGPSGGTGTVHAVCVPEE